MHIITRKSNNEKKSIDSVQKINSLLIETNLMITTANIAIASMRIRHTISAVHLSTTQCINLKILMNLEHSYKKFISPSL